MWICKYRKGFLSEVIQERPLPWPYLTDCKPGLVRLVRQSSGLSRDLQDAGNISENVAAWYGIHAYIHIYIHTMVIHTYIHTYIHIYTYTLTYM